MFVSPNFEINNDQDSIIISPELDDDGVVNTYLMAEGVSDKGSPLAISEDIDRSRLLLTKLANNQSMWLNSDGRIEIGR
jgi:hypothetical protein